MYCKTRRFITVLRILKESDYVCLLLLFGVVLYLHVWLFACARFCIIYYSCIFARVCLFAGSRFEDLLKRLSHIFAVLNVFIENEKKRTKKNEKGKKLNWRIIVFLLLIFLLQTRTSSIRTFLHPSLDFYSNKNSHSFLKLLCAQHTFPPQTMSHSEYWG